MPDLQEDLLQFIWQHRLFRPLPLVTASGKSLDILRPGDLNRDAGPDFFNARINVNGLTLAGNIELHVNSSDWTKHGHESDPNYDNIILHVVYHHDAPVKQNEKHNVEVLELKNLIPDGLIKNYEGLMHSRQELACGSQLAIPTIRNSACGCSACLLSDWNTKQITLRNYFTLRVEIMRKPFTAY